jgi:alpha-tubulin suppressor-like RCC1 family protein
VSVCVCVRRWQVFGWGLGTALGVGSARSQWSPQEVSDLTPGPGFNDHVVKVAAGGGYSAAVTAKGHLFTWGKWSNGRLGACSALV